MLISSVLGRSFANVRSDARSNVRSRTNVRLYAHMTTPRTQCVRALERSFAYKCSLVRANDNPPYAMRTGGCVCVT